MATVHGTDNSETIDENDDVSSQNDQIFGYGGHDTIFGLGGDDQIDGGDGNDDIMGGNGNDFIFGGDGADDIFGGSDADTAAYHHSDAGVTVSLVTGTGAGGDAEGDTLTDIEDLAGSVYNDFLIGNNDSNVLGGHHGNDTLKGGGGDDVLFGGNGDDTLKGGGGADVLNGGGSIDWANYADSSAGVTVSLITGTAGGGDATGDELIFIENLAGSPHADTLWGDDGVNVLMGSGGNDTLKGFGGSDTLSGGDGNDSLIGGDGVDTLIGGRGSDTYTITAGDTVTEFAGEGTDRVNSLITHSLAANVENLTLTGASAINGTGNVLNNVIVGNSANNVLNGGAGNDTFTGGGGNDAIYVDTAADVVIEAAGGGTDNVNTSVSYALTAGVSAETLRTTNAGAVVAINLTGNEINNFVTGNAGNNQLNGGAGIDTLTGNAGNDVFFFNTTLNAVTNVDTVVDFSVANDTFRLENAVFAGLAAGALAADAFHIGPAAADAEDRIIYDNSSGALSFDSNGNAAGGLTMFAQLTAGLALTNADFLVV